MSTGITYTGSKIAANATQAMLYPVDVCHFCVAPDQHQGIFSILKQLTEHPSTHHLVHLNTVCPNMHLYRSMLVKHWTASGDKHAEFPTHLRQ